MTTFSDLVNDVLLLMEGYGLDQGRAAFITTTGGITATDLTFTVDSTEDISPGIAEVGDELIYIQSVDDTSKTVTVSPDGRGYRGTTAAAHAQNARVTFNPVIPRGLLKRKVNETVVGVYPNLFGVGVTSITYDPMVVGYEVPTDVQDILKITYQALGPSEDWLPVRTWSLDKNADTVKFPSGKALNIFDSVYPVSSIRIVYQKQPTELVNDSDDLTVTGLASSARACIVAGTVWRLVSFMDTSRLKVNTSQPNVADDKNPIGTGTQVGSYLRKQYERELADEQQRQQLANPPIMHWTE